METQNNSSRQRYPKKEQNWKYHTPWCQTTVQSYGNQNRIVLAQKWTQVYGAEHIAQKIIHTYMNNESVKKDTKNIQRGKGKFFNKWCEEN